MEKAAYHGLAGEFVRLVSPFTESDPVAMLGQIIVCFGSVVGRGPHFVAEAVEHYGNEFLNLVGETSKARKGSSFAHVRGPFREIDPGWIYTSGLSTGEGLIHAVRDPIVSATGAVQDPGVKDKRLLIQEPEFASILRVMARQGARVSAELRQAWDSGNLQIINKNSPVKATGAHVSVIGHITRTELLRYMDRTEQANGFGNRFLWLCAKRYRVLPEAGRPPAEKMMGFTKLLRAAVEDARRLGHHELRRDAEARELWASVYPALSEGKLGMLGEVTSRAEAHVMRLALLYALLDSSRTIGKTHLEAGLAFWRYAEDSARYIFAGAVGDPLAEEVLKALRAASDGLTRTQISAVFSRHESADRLSGALGNLEASGHVRCERNGTPGRPAETYFAYSPTLGTPQPVDAGLLSPNSLNSHSQEGVKS